MLLGVIGFCFVTAVSVPVVRAQDNIPWHGYIQTRYSENYDNLSSFRVRRAKLWLKGRAPIQGNWYYKMQAIFVEKNKGGFTLQDAYAEYRLHDWRLRAGQQIPEFSLQRVQPDYVIPVLERGLAINNLIPAAETGARDIGAQVIYDSPDKSWHASAGMFNGNGANQLKNEDRQFLFNQRLTFETPVSGKVRAHLGYSLAYRKTSGLTLKKIFGSGRLFSGDDFRWGLEGRLLHPRWEIQGEYIHVSLEDDNAWAYYLLSDYKLTEKNQLVFMLDKYKDLNPQTADEPWFILGFNHYFAGDKAKVMLDSRLQVADNDTHYQSMIQLQLMFH